jgi:dihydroorotase
MDLVIKNGKAFIGGSLRRVDIEIKNGRISDIKKIISGKPFLDAKGMIILPGIIDSHVHFRDLKQKYKEDWFTGSSSAAAGGVTTVIDQPNTDPPTLDRKSFFMKLREAEKKSLIDFGINGGVVGPEKLPSLHKLVTAYGEIFMPELDIKTLSEALRMIKKLGAVACVHAEDSDCLRSHSREISHELRRPPVCEWRAIKVLSQISTGCRVHISHLSTSDGLKEAKLNNFSVEVTPHHLLLSRKDAERLGVYGRMNPPLRDAPHPKYLWRKMNLIDILASDHAPHTKKEKEEMALPGVPGVETLGPLLLECVRKRILSLRKFASLTSENPARIFRLGKKGRIEVGMDADLFLVDMKKRKKISSDMLHSKCGWTPFEGFYGIFPTITIVRGKIVWNGEIVGKGGWGRMVK